MTYSFKKIPPEEMEVKVCDVEGDIKEAILIEDVDITELVAYDILDAEGDSIAVVYSETEADTLVSHLNR